MVFGPQSPDAEVVLELTGREFVLSGYRPQYLIKPDYRTSALHRFIDAERLSIGEKVKAEVWFVMPEAYPHTLWVGRVVSVTEASKVVGRATILKVNNPILSAPTGRDQSG